MVSESIIIGRYSSNNLTYTGVVTLLYLELGFLFRGTRLLFLSYFIPAQNILE